MKPSILTDTTMDRPLMARVICAKFHRFGDDDRCICGGKETVVYVLVDYPKLKDLQ
jgi:hypothetical protein